MPPNKLRQETLLWIGLVFSLLISIAILIKYAHITPFIHPEKIANLTFLWDKSIPDFKKLFSSCTVDACIGRVRPLNYTLEFLDAVYLESLFKATGHTSWKPISNYIIIIFAPIVFFFSNKKYPIAALIISALFFTSFQFVSNFYNYFRPGKEFSLLFLIPALSIIFSNDFRKNNQSSFVLILLIISCLLDEQIIFLVTFFGIAYFLFGESNKKINLYTKTFLTVFTIYLIIIFFEGTNPFVTAKYLKNDAYADFGHIAERFGWFFKNSPMLFFEFIYFEFLGSKLLACFVALFMFIYIFIGKYISNVLCKKTNRPFLDSIIRNYSREESAIFNAKILLTSTIFIWAVSSLFHSAIVIGQKQGLAYYMIIPSFIFIYSLYLVIAEPLEKYLENVAIVLSIPLIIATITYFNFKAINYELVWVKGVYIDVKNSINNQKRYDFQSWQSGAIFTEIANYNCDYTSFNTNEIEKNIFIDKICSFKNKSR
jgi:hypothetical protein